MMTNDISENEYERENDEEQRPESSPQALGVSWLLIAVLIGVLAGLAVLIYRILTTDTHLGLTPAHPAHAESLALIRANERIVQLVQWTISTIFVVAGGLLGLNWYQNQKRYEDDKAELVAFRRRMERRYTNDRRSFDVFRSEIDDRIRKTERAQEQLAEQHRTHLLVQAVDELGRASSVQEAFATIMSWYGQIREADNARQERALSLVWQGFEHIEHMIVEERVAPVFYPDDSAAEARFVDFLTQLSDTYPEVEQYVEFFKDVALRYTE